MRIDKFIADNSDFSRKDVKVLIYQKRVKLSSKRKITASLHLLESEQVYVDGARINALGSRCYMLHKPKGYVCSTVDESHPSVMNLLDVPCRSRLKIVGRLDQDTTGLLLITDNGQWVHSLTSPKKECCKTYVATLADPIAREDCDTLEKGIMLRGEDKPTLPAKVIMLEARKVKISITEGRYHQVKRMFAAVGNKVTQLHRESFGDLSIGALELEQYRLLESSELDQLLNINIEPNQVRTPESNNEQ